LLRPAFSKESGAWSFLVRPQVSVSLVDRGYQKYVLPGATQAGNPLVSWALEANPTYKISEDVSVGLSNTFSQVFTGGAPGAEGSWATATWGYELGIDLPVKAGPVAFSVSVDNETKLNKDFNFWDTQSQNFNFYATASF
jgi:hypothetical protein